MADDPQRQEEWLKLPDEAIRELDLPEREGDVEGFAQAGYFVKVGSHEVYNKTAGALDPLGVTLSPSQFSQYFYK